MKRFTLLVLLVLTSAITWFATVLFGAADSRPELKDAITIAPFYAAVLLGCYALFTVGSKLYRFNDCEEASNELTKVRRGRSKEERARAQELCARVCLSKHAPAPHAGHLSPRGATLLSRISPQPHLPPSPTLSLSLTHPLSLPLQDVAAARRKLKAKGF